MLEHCEVMSNEDLVEEMEKENSFFNQFQFQLFSDLETLVDVSKKQAIEMIQETSHKVELTMFIHGDDRSITILSQ